jgi:hypothetical protein
VAGPPTSAAQPAALSSQLTFHGRLLHHRLQRHVRARARRQRRRRPRRHARRVAARRVRRRGAGRRRPLRLLDVGGQLLPRLVVVVVLHVVAAVGQLQAAERNACGVCVCVCVCAEREGKGHGAQNVPSSTPSSGKRSQPRTRVRSWHAGPPASNVYMAGREAHPWRAASS